MSVNLIESLHLWLAALTLGVICIAALQAILLYIQDRLLHHSHAIPHLLKKMPALETMERWLFRMIVIAFVLLTCLFLSSIYFFSPIFQPPLFKKTLLVFAIWGILFTLLLGRYLSGWRGRKAIIYTLLGFVLMVLVYFGIA